MKEKDSEPQIGQPDNIFDQVFSSEKPPNKINKAFETINKGVSKFSRTVGHDGHSGKVNGDQRDEYLTDDYNHDSSLLPAHDTLMFSFNDSESFQSQYGEDGSSIYDVPYNKQYMNVDSSATHIQDQFQQSATNIPQSWQQNQILQQQQQQLKPGSFYVDDIAYRGVRHPQSQQTRSKPYPQGFYNPTRPQYSSQQKSYSTSQVNNFRRPDNHRYHQPQSYRPHYANPQRRYSYSQVQDQYYDFDEAGRRQKELYRRKLEKNQYKNGQQWSQMIDLNDDQFNDQRFANIATPDLHQYSISSGNHQVTRTKTPLDSNTESYLPSRPPSTASLSSQTVYSRDVGSLETAAARRNNEVRYDDRPESRGESTTPVSSNKKKISIFDQDGRESKFSANALFKKMKRNSSNTLSPERQMKTPHQKESLLSPPTPSSSRSTHYSGSPSPSPSRRSVRPKSALRESRSSSPYTRRNQASSNDPTIDSEENEDEYGSIGGDRPSDQGFFSDIYNNCSNTAGTWYAWASALYNNYTDTSTDSSITATNTNSTSSDGDGHRSMSRARGSKSPEKSRTSSARSFADGPPPLSDDDNDEDEDGDNYSFKGMGENLDTSPPKLEEMRAQTPQVTGSAVATPISQQKPQKRGKRRMNLFFQRSSKTKPDRSGATSRLSNASSGRSSSLGGRSSALSGRTSAMSLRTADSKGNEDESVSEESSGSELSDFQKAIGPVVSLFVSGFRSCARFSFVLRPLDAVADTWPALQNIVVVLELLLLMWILYQISIIIEAIATAIKTLCMPVIIISRFLGMKY